MLASVVESVEEIEQGKKIVLIDGVGYPAVGSICGISNADAAKALNASVLLIGKSGVGDAVDSFNLNCRYDDNLSVIYVFFKRRSTCNISGFLSTLESECWVVSSIRLL